MVVPGITRVVAPTALLWGVGYLGWRIVATRDGADLTAWLILLLAEMLGFAVFGVRVWQAWPSSPPIHPNLVKPEISVVIDATGARVDDVRATLISVREMHDRSVALVVDEPSGIAPDLAYFVVVLRRVAKTMRHGNDPAANFRCRFRDAEDRSVGRGDLDKVALFEA